MLIIIKMGNNEETRQEENKPFCSTRVKQVCCISTLVIVIVVAIIAFKNRFRVISETNEIFTGNEYPIIGDESIMS